jgi:hypothetical protein
MPEEQPTIDMLSREFGRKAESGDIAGNMFGKGKEYPSNDVAAGCLQACEEGNFRNMGSWFAAAGDTSPGQSMALLMFNYWDEVAASIEKAAGQGEGVMGIMKTLVSGVANPECREEVVSGIVMGALRSESHRTLRIATTQISTKTMTRLLAHVPATISDTGIAIMREAGADLVRASADAEKDRPDHSDRLRRFDLSEVHHYYETGRYGKPEDVAATEARGGHEHSPSIRLGCIDRALKGEGFDNLNAWFTAADQRNPGETAFLMRHDLRDIATALDRAQAMKGNAEEIIRDMLDGVKSDVRPAVQQKLLSEVSQMTTLAVPEQLMYALHRNGTDFSKVADDKHPQAALLKRMDGLFSLLTKGGALPAPVVGVPERVSEAITVKMG